MLGSLRVTGSSSDRRSEEGTFDVGSSSWRLRDVCGGSAKFWRSLPGVSARRRHALYPCQLREDLHFVGWAGRDPDQIYEADELEHNEPLKAWVRRRPQLENELDTLDAQAADQDRELDPEEEELVGALKELREAEARAREERREEEERRLEGPDDDDGLSLA